MIRHSSPPPGQLFTQKLQIAAEIADGLDRGQIKQRPAIGLPVVAVEPEDRGGGPEIADGVFGPGGVARLVDLTQEPSCPA